MKRYQINISFILIFVLLFSITQNSLMVGFYMLDTKDFVELFCENTEIPEMECNGKCELSKLAHHDENKSERPSLLDNLKNELVYYADSFSSKFLSIPKNTTPEFEYHNRYKFLFSKQINHPPILV